MEYLKTHLTQLVQSMLVDAAFFKVIVRFFNNLVDDQGEDISLFSETTCQRSRTSRSQVDLRTLGVHRWKLTTALLDISKTLTTTAANEVREDEAR